MHIHNELQVLAAMHSGASRIMLSRPNASPALQAAAREVLALRRQLHFMSPALQNHPNHGAPLKARLAVAESRYRALAQNGARR
jgi:hypothetical protein